MGMLAKKALSYHSILVVVAHPDDEILGVGGTIAQHSANGDEVRVLFLTNGVGARDASDSDVERRATAARRAAEIVGARSLRFLDFPDNRLDDVPLLDVVKAVERSIAETQPETIYTHHLGDLNIDHAICHRAVLTACRPIPGFPINRILACEIPSSTEWAFPSRDAFIPTRFVDIAEVLEIKRRALEAYAEEMRPFPHPRSYEAVEALARWRGATVGVVAAEAFEVVREVVR